MIIHWGGINSVAYTLQAGILALFPASGFEGRTF